MKQIKELKRSFENEIGKLENNLADDKKTKTALERNVRRLKTESVRTKLQAEADEARKFLEKEAESRQQLEDSKKLMEREIADLRERLTEKETAFAEAEHNSKLKLMNLATEKKKNPRNDKSAKKIEGDLTATCATANEKEKKLIELSAKISKLKANLKKARLPMNKNMLD